MVAILYLYCSSLYGVPGHHSFLYGQKLASMEMPGIEPGASHMRSERSTTELHPHDSQVTAVGLIVTDSKVGRVV